MAIDIQNISGYTLRNLNRINIILGKNGCGKSLLLRSIEQSLISRDSRFGKTKYITPERGGTLTYEAGTEQNIANNINWLSDTRRRNQHAQFREQSVVQYRKLETLVLREVEGPRRDEKEYTFNTFVDKINCLLDNIYIRRADTTFKIYHKRTNAELNATIISSGESELISIAIECLIFYKECTCDKENILFLDEPDVHLHPDLQVRLMHFLKELANGSNFKIIIATHSTAILGSLESYEYTNIAFMKFDQKDIQFCPITSIYRRIIPVFGAHPLSNVFNEAPILLVEGEDDERIWQQAIRTSIGKIKLYPCSCDSIENIKDFEEDVKNIINSVYDDAKAYSIRDRDDNPTELDDLPSLKRLKLCCRNAENLLLSDEVLNSFPITWQDLKDKINHWIDTNLKHVHYETMKAFKDNGYDRKNFNIKEIRNDLMGIIGDSKPWEVAIGQVIGRLTWNDSTNYDVADNMHNYLGEKLVKSIIPKGS